jgi:hypothetical protein
MEFAYSFSQSLPLVKKFQVNETVSNVGVPLTVPAEGGAGIALATTSTATDMIGVNLDTATFVTAQQTDGTSAERKISVNITPDAVWKMKISGGLVDNTALVLYPITSAASDGLTCTTSSIADWTSPDFDEGAIWFLDGPNKGAVRRVISGSSAVATVKVAFDNGTLSGDNLMRVNAWPLGSTTLGLTTNLTQVNALIAVATGAAFRCIDLDVQGRTDSFVYATSNDHALREAT